MSLFGNAPQYKVFRHVVTADKDDHEFFEAMINAALREGFELHGPLQVLESKTAPQGSRGFRYELIQAMVKLKPTASTLNWRPPCPKPSKSSYSMEETGAAPEGFR